MKILELHYSTSWAGAERFVVDLSNELSKSQELVLCTINDDSIAENAYYKSDLASTVKYINLGCKRGLSLTSLVRIYKTIRKEKPNVVHAHTDAINIWIPSILLTKTTYFHTLHNLASKCVRYKNLRSFYKYFYLRRIKPISISNVCLQSYHQFYSLYNAAIINNGRSRLLVSYMKETVQKEINALKQHKDDKVFIHVARYAEQKNQSLLIAAFNKLRQEGYPLILIIIGNGYDDAPIRNIAHKGIYFLGTKNNVADYLKYSDYFVLSSLWEGLPISLLEAIASGVIPICTPAGGIVDVINDEIGYISPNFELKEFVNTLKRAINNEKRISPEILVDYYWHQFSIENCSQSYLALFNHINKKNDVQQ